MALSAAVLSSLMQSNIGNIAGINITSPTELASFCNAVAAAVVTHITGAGVVSVTTTTTGVTPGGGTAPGTGTGTIA